MNELETIIHQIIKSQGPISLAAYMELALQHPLYGYYRVREPVGRTGDFITAPEVSQMFGEMIGVWCAEVWRAMGKPEHFALVELGPGRGTMMQDILRATANISGFRDSLQLFLLDSDHVLRARQRETLSKTDVAFIETVSELPTIASIIVANEFFDALPVRAFEKTFSGWAEKMVGLAHDRLVMVNRDLDEAEKSLIPPELLEGVPGTIWERSAKAGHFVQEIAKHLRKTQGAALIIDYGYVASSHSATLQAVSNHSMVDIFERPGEVDLTAHVDFAWLADRAREEGATVSQIVGQGQFLRGMGIKIRADTLKNKASLPQAADIDVALKRLIDVDQMGQLFKVMQISSDASVDCLSKML